MTAALTITNLSKTYPNGVQALKQVSLSIGKGMFGLLGPNGAGKSTLMRTIATLQVADTGTITFGEIDVLGQRDEVRKILGYLPQEFGVYPKLTPEAMLHHLAILKGLTNKAERKDVVDELLNQTNLYSLRKKHLGGFSGGMKQRFGIAQALLGNPKLIIVDEPTAGLDPAERLRFYNLLSAIGENIVVILSTHIVDDVSVLCGDMAIISEGEVLLTGHPLTIVEQLQGKVWKRLIGRTELASFRSEFKVISTRLVSGQTLIHVYNETRPDESFEAVEADLEDVYFSTLQQQPAGVS
jgi:ABC-2 type transport system ATP-binding protein